MTRSQNRRSRAALRTHYVRRILAHYASADDATRLAGADWYGDAAATAQAIADLTGKPFATVCATIAALSPRVHWVQNVKAARTMLLAASNGEPQPVVAGTGSNRRKAWAMANGADPSTLTGPKVRAFYANISGDHSRATVDVWAAKAAAGRLVVPSRFTYPVFESAYVSAAVLLGISTAAVQAVVWVAVRGSAS